MEKKSNVEKASNKYSISLGKKESIRFKRNFFLKEINATVDVLK